MATFHHAVIDIPYPPRVGNDEAQSQHTHENICDREPDCEIADAHNQARAEKRCQFDYDLHTILEITLSCDFQLQGYSLLVVDGQLEDDEMYEPCHQEHIGEEH